MCVGGGRGHGKRDELGDMFWKVQHGHSDGVWKSCEKKNFEERGVVIFVRVKERISSVRACERGKQWVRSLTRDKL